MRTMCTSWLMGELSPRVMEKTYSAIQTWWRFILVLRVVKLNAGYGKLQVLFDIDVEAHDRKITTIIGANGAARVPFSKLSSD